MGYHLGRLDVAQKIAPAGASVATAAFGAQTYKIAVSATAAVNIKVGSGAATANDFLLPANTLVTLTVSPGQTLAAFGTATVYVQELA